MVHVKSKQKAKTSRENQNPNHRIGTLSEKSLHSALKAWYARPGDRLEGMVDGFHIDIVRPKLLIEIQTTNFSSIKNKLNTLTEKHRVRLVFPIAQEKWIIRLATDGVSPLGRRKSPKKGRLFHLLEELVSFPNLIKNRNFSLEVPLTREEEIRCDEGQGPCRRNGWSIVDYRFLDMVSRHIFNRTADFLYLIPSDLPDPFSTQELAENINQPRWLAQKMAYYLRNMEVFKVVGKDVNSILYSASKKAPIRSSTKPDW